MSKLQAIKAASSLQDFAALLKYKAHTLSYILYVKKNKYDSFEIGSAEAASGQSIHPPRI
jgi:hypothetical protein